jgi:hypothetical protein
MTEQQLERIAPNRVAYMPHALYILHEVWQKSGKELPQGLKAFLHGFTRCPISSRLKIDSNEKPNRIIRNGL